MDNLDRLASLTNALYDNDENFSLVLGLNEFKVKSGNRTIISVSFKDGVWVCVPYHDNGSSYNRVSLEEAYQVMTIVKDWIEGKYD